MLLARKWAVRHSGAMETLYRVLERCLRAMQPLLRAIGYARVERPIAGVERAVKGLLFDCRMCGDCMLSVTGMSCWSNCPKGLRNGPCGGVRQNSMCEVDPRMLCVWVEAWRGSGGMRAGRLPVRPNPPLDNTLAKRSSWLRVLREETSGAVPGPPPTTALSGSRLERLLSEKTFVVTAEFSPPDSADPEEIARRLEPFRCVDALNVTDGSGANCHMSSIAVSALLVQAGCEPVMQITCRDRNRIAIQGDILGAAALGVKNLLCLTGDGVASGDHPGAKHVGDLDAVTLLSTARNLRDEGRYLSGRKLTVPPRMLLGGADNPFAPPFDLRPDRLARKIAAGAQFVQTQYCFDAELLERYLDRVRAEGLHERCSIIIGVGPIGSARTARWLREKIPGVHIPEAIVSRLEKAGNPRDEGKRICVELVQRIRAMPGIAGVHLMTPKQDQLIPEILDMGGLSDRHQVMHGRSRLVESN